jgi:hypothetical protein
MVETAHAKIKTDISVEFFLFTDRVDLESEVLKFKDKFRFTFISIPSYGWPDATIKRYELMDRYRHLLSSEVLLYLDSDMLIRENFIPELLLQLKFSDMVLVLHPGFYRPKGFQLIKFYARSPQVLVTDFILRTQLGGIGTWENRTESAAFVPRSRRTHYVCGGTWFGLNQTFLRYVEILHRQVDLDASNQIMAIWHDESHLNNLAVNHKVTFSDPRFCFDPRFANLRGLPNLIEAVNKNE